MRILLALLLLAAPLGASAQSNDGIGGAFRRLWERFRGNQRPPVEQPKDGSLGRLVSWNVQTLGKKASRAKKDALRLSLARAFAGAGPSILAAQEVANDKGSATLFRQLPDGGEGWTAGFEDTPDAMNNALYFGPGVTVDCAGNVMIDGVQHPPYMAHVTVGKADFTILSVHLSYAKGRSEASSEELKLIMAWVKALAAKPGADPDFIIAGDFNLPTEKGKDLSRRAGNHSWEPVEASLPRGFTALVDEATSRHGREESSNNYDHFVVSDDFLNEELVVAGAVSTTEVAAAERDAGARASDHFPIALTFRVSGNDLQGKPIALDGASLCR